MWVTELGRCTDVIPEDPKALSPMLVTLLGIETDFRLVVYLNAPFPILVMPSGISRLVTL